MATISPFLSAGLAAVIVLLPLFFACTAPGDNTLPSLSGTITVEPIGDLQNTPNTLPPGAVESVLGQTGVPSKETAGQLWSESLTLETNGDYAGAIVKMKAFSTVSSDEYLLYVRLGWLNYMNKQYIEAEQAYKQASQYEASSVTPYLGLASSYWADGRTPRAIEACNQVLTLEPTNYTAIKMLAAIAYQNNDFSEASRRYLSLLALHPEDESVLSGAGWSLLKINRKDLAHRCFERLIIISPTYSYAQDGLSASQ